MDIFRFCPVYENNCVPCGFLSRTPTEKVLNNQVDRMAFLQASVCSFLKALQRQGRRLCIGSTSASSNGADQATSPSEYLTYLQQRSVTALSQLQHWDINQPSSGRLITQASSIMERTAILPRCKYVFTIDIGLLSLNAKFLFVSLSLVLLSTQFIVVVSHQPLLLTREFVY